jgi:hypothetical protein
LRRIGGDVKALIRLVQSGPGPLAYMGDQEAAILVFLIGLGLTLLLLRGLGLASVKDGMSALSERISCWNAKRVYSGRKDGLLVGPLWVPDKARVRHVHVVGATGSGKTVLIEQMIMADVRRGLGGIIIDAKGDRDLYLRIKTICRSIGREADLVLLSATHTSESAIWNPCVLGSASELQSKFYNSSIYDNPHYAKAVENGLLVAFDALLKLHGEKAFTVREVAHFLKDRFKGSASENLEGLHLDLANLAASEWAPVMGVGAGEADKSRIVDIMDVISGDKILFVDLPTEAKAVQSSRIGRLLLQEVILISGMRKIVPGLRNGRPFPVYVDEFDAFATPSFATFLNKGRSSDFMITVGHQTLSQLEKIGDGFSGEIIGNTNLRLVFRQDTPDDAEEWAKVVGTEHSVKSTYRTSNGSKTGESSNRDVEQYVVHPNVIKKLRIGECVAIMKSPYVFRKIRVPFEETMIAEDLKGASSYRVEKRVFDPSYALAIDDNQDKRLQREARALMRNKQTKQPKENEHGSNENQPS